MDKGWFSFKLKNQGFTLMHRGRCFNNPKLSPSDHTSRGRKYSKLVSFQLDSGKISNIDWVSDGSSYDESSYNILDYWIEKLLSD